MSNSVKKVNSSSQNCQSLNGLQSTSGSFQPESSLTSNDIVPRSSSPRSIINNLSKNFSLGNLEIKENTYKNEYAFTKGDINIVNTIFGSSSDNRYSTEFEFLSLLCMLNIPKQKELGVEKICSAVYGLSSLMQNLSELSVSQPDKVNDMILRSYNSADFIFCELIDNFKKYQTLTKKYHNLDRKMDESWRKSVGLQSYSASERCLKADDDLFKANKDLGYTRNIYNSYGLLSDISFYILGRALSFTSQPHIKVAKEKLLVSDKYRNEFAVLIKNYIADCKLSKINNIIPKEKGGNNLVFANAIQLFTNSYHKNNFEFFSKDLSEKLEKAPRDVLLLGFCEYLQKKAYVQELAQRREEKSIAENKLSFVPQLKQPKSTKHKKIKNSKSVLSKVDLAPQRPLVVLPAPKAAPPPAKPQQTTIPLVPVEDKPVDMAIHSPAPIESAAVAGPSVSIIAPSQLGEFQTPLPKQRSDIKAIIGRLAASKNSDRRQAAFMRLGGRLEVCAEFPVYAGDVRPVRNPDGSFSPDHGGTCKELGRLDSVIYGKIGDNHGFVIVENTNATGNGPASSANKPKLPQIEKYLTDPSFSILRIPMPGGWTFEAPVVGVCLDCPNYANQNDLDQFAQWANDPAKQRKLFVCRTDNDIITLITQLKSSAGA